MEAKDGPDGDEGQQMKQEYTFEGAVSTKARRFRQLDPETLPRSFSTNSNKEDLVLEYVANFEAQFNEMMPGRTGRVLFSPYNECDVRKFICTTVRPTELPHRDLYHAPACAQFVANLLAYEPLEPPTEVPDRVPSPLSVLQWRVGDSFDFALLLTSFLVGAGYDAYCVQGTAPRWITQRNESLRPAPELLKPDPESEAVGQAKTKGVAEAKDSAAAAGLPEEEEKYAVRSHGMPSSKFEAAQGAKARAAEAALAAKGEADSESDADDDDDEEDPLEGQRVHCWVLVRAPSRDVSEHFFIEATTGATFPVGEGTPYQSVEAIWSSKNHYVNMQTEEAVGDLRWELDVLDDWENVFIEPLTAAGGGGGEEKDGEDDLDAFGGGGDEEEGGEDDDGEENEVDDAAILDLPQSWVPKLEVDHALYRHRYSAGEQAVTLHRRSKFEKYAAFAHPQGLRERLSTFKDGARTIPKEIRERFENRDDKLYWRLRCPLASTSEEHFLPGRGAALRARHENHGRRRVLTFYPAARPDGLVSREDEIGQKYIMRFKDRDDYLVYRSVRVTQDRAEAGDSQFTLPGGQLGELYIVKMTEKYDRDPSKGPYDKIRKQTYYCAKGEVRFSAACTVTRRAAALPCVAPARFRALAPAATSTNRSPCSPPPPTPPRPTPPTQHASDPHDLPLRTYARHRCVPHVLQGRHGNQARGN